MHSGEIKPAVRLDAGHKLSWTEVLSYGSGSMASNMTWGLISAFLIVYYTDVALMPVAAVGTLILVTRIFDAIFDPLVGMLVDRTRTRWGKARPYMLFASIPFAVLSVMTFTVPDGSMTFKFVYAYATFGLLGILYALLYVPYGALQALMTVNRKQMLRLSSVRAMGTSVVSIFLYVLAVPLITYFGGGQSGYTGAAIFFAAVTTILYFVTFLNCRERTNADPSSDRSPVAIALRRALKNPIWRIAMAFEILIFIRLGVLVSGMAFYAKLVLGSAASLSIVFPSLSVAILFGGMIAAPYLQKFGHRKGMIYVLLFTMAVYSLIPVFGYTTLGFTLVLSIGAIGFGIQATLAFSLIAESVEVQEKMFGSRDAGLLTSTASFNQKVGFAIGAACLAWALASVDYKPDSVGDGAATLLVWMFCLVPVVFAALQILVLLPYKERGPEG